MSLVLHGGDLEKDLPLRASEVTHLRLVLAWMRTEYMLDEDMQRGYADGARLSVEGGFATEGQAREVLASKAAEIRHVPQYVRHGVKMLTKMLREHEKRSGVVDVEVMRNRLEATPPLIADQA